MRISVDARRPGREWVIAGNLKSGSRRACCARLRMHRWKRRSCGKLLAAAGGLDCAADPTGSTRGSNADQHDGERREPAARRRTPTLLVQYLREACGLTGTKIGCDTSSCGACTVLVDGESVKSCTMFAAQADGGSRSPPSRGSRTDGELHPVQQAFHENHGLQCGFCTAGMVMAAVSFLEENPTRPSATCASGSRATSAAAPATRTSSRRCSRGRGQRQRR